MRRLCVCLCTLLSISLIDAASITNAQLLQLLEQDPGANVQDYLIPNNAEDDDVTTENDDEVIDLPGNPDDEVDVEALMDKFGLSDLTEENLQTQEDPLGAGVCTCRSDACTCCIGKTVTIKILFKKISSSIHACVTVQYLPSSTSFRLSLTLNSQTVYNEEVSLTHPPNLCFTVSKAIGIIKWHACLHIYKVNLVDKSLCTKLIGNVSFRIKKLYFSWNIACFRIPTLSHDWLPGKQPMVAAERLLTSDDDETNQDYQI